MIPALASEGCISPHAAKTKPFSAASLAPEKTFVGNFTGNIESFRSLSEPLRELLSTVSSAWAVVQPEPGISPQPIEECLGDLSPTEADIHQSRLNAASRDPLNPLATPGRRLEGICEILCLVHDLTVAELHNAHCVCWAPLVGDCIFRDPEIAFPKNSLDIEA
jgi:hypothetical protein